MVEGGARVLVVEPHASGHHSTYLRWVVEGITERGWNAVVATTAEALSHPLLSGLARLPRVDLRVVETVFPVGGTANRASMLRHEFVHWRSMRRIVGAELNRGPLMAVVLPYLDYCFVACGILGVPYRGVPWHVISMRLSVPEGGSESRIPWKWRLLRRFLAARWLGTLFAINPSVRSAPRAWLNGKDASKIKYLPDPAEDRGVADRTAARAGLGLAPGQLAILVFGYLDERKGIGRLATALASDPALLPYVLVVAGLQTERLAASLRASPFVELRNAGRLIVLDRVLDDTGQAQVFAAADIVWLGYEGHSFMSGVLVLAGHAGRPVIAIEEGEMGAFVREHGFGVLIEREGTRSAVPALLRLMRESERAAMGRRALTAVANHTPANFKRSLIAAIEAQALTNEYSSADGEIANRR